MSYRNILLVFLTLAISLPTLANSIEEGSQKVQDFLNSTELARIKTYCTAGTDDCRTLYQRKDKKTGKLSLSFYDKFSSRDRGLESVCYLIHNPETGKYEVYSDLTADGVVEIDQHLPQNKNVQVVFDDSNFPTVSNLILSKLGTDSGLIGVMSFSPSQSYVKGHLIKLNKPKEKGDEITVKYNSIPTGLAN